MIVRTGNSPTRTVVTDGRARVARVVPAYDEQEVCEHGFYGGWKRTVRTKKDERTGKPVSYSFLVPDRDRASVDCTHPSRKESRT